MKFTREVDSHGMHHQEPMHNMANSTLPHEQIEKHFYIHEESLHHMMMFGGFLLSSFVELIIYYGVSLPKKTADIFQN